MRRDIESLVRETERIMIARLEEEDPRVYGPVAGFIRRGGKRLRPRLALHSCGAAGGDREDALEDAAMVELFHEFTLIHDDVIDRSETRRGAPTLHKSHGMGIAINSGDALYNLLWKWMLALPLAPQRLIALQTLYAGNLKRVVDGQGIELDWERRGRFDITEEEYVKMALGKTSALMELACGSGAFFADADEGSRACLEGYGRWFGLAFQIRDDIADVLDGQGEDLIAGKRTFLLAHMNEDPSDPELAELIGILSGGHRDDCAVERARGIISDCGAISHAEKEAVRFSGMAVSCLEGIPDGPDKEALKALAGKEPDRKG